MVEKRQLGATELLITPIGLGTWAIGGGHWAYGWGHQDDGESVAAIHRAVHLGINWIDTAAVYGLGHAEEVVARALQAIPQSSRPFVFTKCSLVWDERRRLSHSLKSESIRREVEASLRRLRVETIDLYQIHWPSYRPGDRADDLEEGWSTLVELQKAGKVRHIGVSNFDVSQLERVQAVAPVASVQPPYSMLSRGVEASILPHCQTRNIGVIIYSPLQSGLLSGAMTRERVASLPNDDWRSTKSLDFREPALTRNLELVEFLRNIGRRHSRSVAEVAIAWTLRHPAVTGAIVGARRPVQVDGFIGAMDFRLTDEDIREIAKHLSVSA